MSTQVSSGSEAVAARIEAPRWSSIAVAGLVLFLFGGLLGLLIAIFLAVARTRGGALSEGVPRAVSAGEFAGAQRLATFSSTAVAVFLILDLLAIVCAQYVGGMLYAFGASSFALSDQPMNLAHSMIEARLFDGLPWMLLALSLMWLGGRYARLSGGADLPINPAIRAVLATAMLECTYSIFVTTDMPQAAILIDWSAVFFLLYGARALGRALLKRFGVLDDCVVLVGDDAAVGRSSRDFSERKGASLRCLDATLRADDPALQALTADLRQYTDGTPLIVLCAPPDELTAALRTARWVESQGVACGLSVDLGDAGRDGLGDDASLSEGVLLLQGRLRAQRTGQRLAKWMFDRCGALVGLVLFAPVFVVLAFIVRLDGGPALFVHERVGRGGARFKCLKIRSMCRDADAVLADLLARDERARAEWERDFKLKQDPRITRVGRFLRRTSLDEIPQFLNVLKGEMSLVGPRPIVEQELRDFYGESAAAYMSVKPGLTGLWQVSGRNDLSYEERVSLDTEYARKWSLGMDVLIMLKTLETMMQRRGAY